MIGRLKVGIVGNNLVVGSFGMVVMEFNWVLHMCNVFDSKLIRNLLCAFIINANLYAHNLFVY